MRHIMTKISSQLHGETPAVTVDSGSPGLSKPKELAGVRLNVVLTELTILMRQLVDDCVQVTPPLHPGNPCLVQTCTAELFQCYFKIGRWQSR